MLSKRTYTIPPDIARQFDLVVPAGKRSSVVTRLLKEWLEWRRQEQLRKDIIAGCQDMNEEYLRIEEEFHPLEAELEREFSDEPL